MAPRTRPRLLPSGVGATHGSPLQDAMKSPPDRGPRSSHAPCSALSIDPRACAPVPLCFVISHRWCHHAYSPFSNPPFFKVLRQTLYRAHNHTQWHTNSLLDIRTLVLYHQTVPPSTIHPAVPSSPIHLSGRINISQRPPSTALLCVICDLLSKSICGSLLCAPLFPSW
jgi:hypothetical protein